MLRSFVGWSEQNLFTEIQLVGRLHWLKKFLHKEMLGFTRNNEFFSGVVREEMITVEEALTRLREANKLLEDFFAEFVAKHDINSPDFAWAISCGEKHEETDNKSLHLTPKAWAFLAFAISV